MTNYNSFPNCFISSFLCLIHPIFVQVFQNDSYSDKLLYVNQPSFNRVEGSFVTRSDKCLWDVTATNHIQFAKYSWSTDNGRNRKDLWEVVKQYIKTNFSKWSMVKKNFRQGYCFEHWCWYKCKKNIYWNIVIGQSL